MSLGFDHRGTIHFRVIDVLCFPVHTWLKVFRRIASFLALLAAAATLSIFLLHSAAGPFPVRYGPATALRASRNRAVLVAAISTAGKTLNLSSTTPHMVRSLRCSRTVLAGFVSALLQPDLANLAFALRC